MWNLLPVSLTAVAFLGAGVFNSIGTQKTRTDFVQWGYPAWWCRITGGLEVATAALIAVPATRNYGLIFGAAIVAAAVLTVLRARDYSHLAPLGVFAALVVLSKIIS